MLPLDSYESYPSKVASKVHTKKFLAVLCKLTKWTQETKCPFYMYAAGTKFGLMNLVRFFVLCVQEFKMCSRTRWDRVWWSTATQTRQTFWGRRRKCTERLKFIRSLRLALRIQPMMRPSYRTATGVIMLLLTSQLAAYHTPEATAADTKTHYVVTTTAQATWTTTDMFIGPIMTMRQVGSM